VVWHFIIFWKNNWWIINYS